MSKIYTLGSIFPSRSPTTVYEFVFLSYMIKKNKTTMNNFLIINFNEQMEIQVYKYGSLWLMRGSAFDSMESCFQKSWMEVYDWCIVQKVQG